MVICGGGYCWNGGVIWVVVVVEKSLSSDSEEE